MEKLETKEVMSPNESEMGEINKEYKEFANQASKKFLATMENMQWFIVRYFGQDEFSDLVDLANKGEGQKLVDRLNNIWFTLPDNIFNIIENPPGWEDLLHIVEI